MSSIRRRQRRQPVRRPWAGQARPALLDEFGPVLALLWGWAESYPTFVGARALWFPRWGVRFGLTPQGGLKVIAEGFEAGRSTAPTPERKIDEFTWSLLDLPEEDRPLVLALIDAQHEPWLKGERWSEILTSLGLRPSVYALRLRASLLNLEAGCRERGLLR